MARVSRKMTVTCSPRLIQNAAPSCAAPFAVALLAHFVWLLPSFLTPIRETRSGHTGSHFLAEAGIGAGATRLGAVKACLYAPHQGGVYSCSTRIVSSTPLT